MPRPTYDPVPHDDFELHDHPSDSDEFKDKPLPLRRKKGVLWSSLRLSRRFLTRFCRPSYILVSLAVFLAWQVTFNVPYADSRAPSFEVNTQETVFIAANIIDGALIRGAWGDSVVELVKTIGVDRVFVSVYGGPGDALLELDARLEDIGLGVEMRRIVSEEMDPLDLGKIPRTRLPTGEERIKRIAFLAEVRNKVLSPLSSPSHKVKWDKVLFLNDVFFDVAGALRLLWGTKGHGGEEPKAVCAADFVASWKYYDTFATRDSEGFSIGVPIFPWFSGEGEGGGVTRQDVRAGRDNVRVRSCWGGMVAFQGMWFQGGQEEGLRFRSEPEPFWDSSECCLIHADIISSSSSSPSPPSPSSPRDKEEGDTGIYLNPFVRTSYSASTHKYLFLAKRFEALFSPLQSLLNSLAHMPRFNYRRSEREGDVIADKLWISIPSPVRPDEQFRAQVEAMGGVVDRLPEDVVFGVGMRAWETAHHREKIGGRATLGTVKGKEFWAKEGWYVPFNRTAKRGGYCGVRQLLVLKEGGGGGSWDNLLYRVPVFEM